MKFNRLLKALSFSAALLLLALSSRGQSSVREVSGRVLDSTGEPLIGASIQVKGAPGGYITDLNGRYEIKNLKVPATLIVSFIGYKDSEITLSGSETVPFDIVLSDSANILDDVVVVGYATMKRRDLVGAVDKVDSEVVGDRSNGNLARSLQGEIAGLNISFNDGKPSSGASVNVRGSTSIGAGGSPLALIDGVEGSLDMVNPQDVESVSVLKDASSTAVYGARGAFGVILVTTKNARKGTPVINYSGSVSVKRRTVDFHNITDSIEWLDWWKTCYNQYYNGSRALLNHIDSKSPYSEAIYNEIIRRNQDPSLSKVAESYDVSGFGYAYYGNTDWMNEFYKKYSGATEHNLSVSGGNENADYYISGRYYGSDGIYKVGTENYNRYNLRAKGSLKVRPWLRITNNLSLSVGDDIQPRTQNGADRGRYYERPSAGLEVDKRHERRKQHQQRLGHRDISDYVKNHAAIQTDNPAFRFLYLSGTMLPETVCPVSPARTVRTRAAGQTVSRRLPDFSGATPVGRGGFVLSVSTMSDSSSSLCPDDITTTLSSSMIVSVPVGISALRPRMIPPMSMFFCSDMSRSGIPM